MSKLAANLEFKGSLKVGVIGLGYVGLPLAAAFGKSIDVVGFDTDLLRVEQLKRSFDKTRETSEAALIEASYLSFTADPSDLAVCNVFIITVPTPIDSFKRPDLRPLKSASKTVGSVLKRRDVVIYESTVYPGATEEDCVPILEAESGLKLNEGFVVGYSPERINPGDELHRLTSITKITSGSTPEALDFIDSLYKSIISAGTYKAPSIRVAEAAKVIENTQRDINIALINELAVIFNHLDIDTQEVLEAASTKWNFLPFRPGLVGGHCIGVDPYYLTHRAQSIGYHPEVILAGRKINDGMGAYVASRLIKKMSSSGLVIGSSRILVMGFSFKENCPDVRNTRVIDVVEELESYSCDVDIFDPWVDEADLLQQYGKRHVKEREMNSYDAIVLAVGHNVFKQMGINKIRGMGKSECIIFDVKALFELSETDLRL